MPKNIFFILLLGLLLNSSAISCMKKNRSSEGRIIIFSNLDSDSLSTNSNSNSAQPRRKYRSRKKFDEYKRRDGVYQCPNCTHSGQTAKQLGTHFSEKRHGHLKGIAKRKYSIKKRKPKAKANRSHKRKRLVAFATDTDVDFNQKITKKRKLFMVFP